MKRALLPVFILLLSTWSAIAQNISVKTFQALPMDMSASSLEGKKIDQNGDVAALIKIVTSQMGFTFEGGTLGIVDTKQENGEIWVWVPHGSRKITIKHQQLGVLRDYRYPIEIESERTYEMVLVIGVVETVVKEQVTQQYLAFQIDPPTATLEVNDQIWELDSDGVAMKYVGFGDYSYRVQSPNYYTDAGRITVNDPENTQKVRVTLRPNFGWISVPESGSLKGASVYVDNVFKGKTPFKSEGLKSGSHSVRIVREMYDPYNTTVMVEDGQTTTVQPSLNANFAEVTLKVDANAEIWVNNEKKGLRSWSGPLENGTYRIECKMDNHESTSITQVISTGMNGETIVLPSPKPIFASLNVESTPAFAKIYIDGKDIGETPKSISEILIGTHEIRLVKENYNEYIGTITINKGEKAQVKIAMDDLDYEQLALQGDDYYFCKDYDKALECYRAAAEHGDAYGKNRMGVYCRNVSKDYQEAVNWFVEAARQGNANALLHLSSMYIEGLGVKRDYAKGKKYRVMAAEKGDVESQISTGVSYLFGNLAFEKDYAEAMKWFQKAAAQNHPKGLYYVGYMYARGYGVQTDDEEACRWYRKSAELGWYVAQYHLGWQYEKGIGVKKDYVEAARWYRKAAEQDCHNHVTSREAHDAQVKLGELYEKGLGVEKNIEEAVKWYQMAAEMTYDKDAKEALERLKKEGKL